MDKLLVLIANKMSRVWLVRRMHFLFLLQHIRCKLVLICIIVDVFIVKVPIFLSTFLQCFRLSLS
jgi:hypothetical protein